MCTIYSFTEKEMSGQTIDFNQYRGKVLLIVNTASKCGLAPQLEGLEALYQEYQSQGLAILGLPSNQFHQEIAADEISQYCQLHYGVTFPMTQPVLVNGEGEDPLFTYLKQAAGHGRIKWNYTKFLIGRNGQMIHRYSPTTAPAKMSSDIQQALNS